MHQNNLPGAQPEVTDSTSTSSDDHSDTNSTTESTGNDHTSNSSEVSANNTGPTTGGYMSNGVQPPSSNGGQHAGNNGVQPPSSNGGQHACNNGVQPSSSNGGQHASSNGGQHASSVSAPTNHEPTGNDLSIIPAATGGHIEVQTQTLPLQLPLGRMALAPSTVISTNVTQFSTKTWALVPEADPTHASTQSWALSRVGEGTRTAAPWGGDFLPLRPAPPKCPEFRQLLEKLEENCSPFNTYSKQRGDQALVHTVTKRHTSTQAWALVPEADPTHASTQSWAFVAEANLTHASTRVWAPALEANLTHASTQAPTPGPDPAPTMPMVAANRTFGFGIPTPAPVLVQVPASILDPAPVWVPASAVASAPVMTFAPSFTLPVAPVPAPASVPAAAPVPAPAFAVAEHPSLAQTKRWFPVLAPTFTQPLFPLPTCVQACGEGQAVAPALASAQAAEASAPQPQYAFSETAEEALAASGPKTNLIINNLPYNITQEEFYGLFAGIGKIRSHKLMRNRMTGESLGYGFVDYVYPSDAQKALYLMNGFQCFFKTIRVSYARTLSCPIQYANLYISGLPKTMTQNELEQLFSPFGHIVASKILTHRINGASQGVGFIHFSTTSEAEEAIKALNGQKLSNMWEPLVVKFARRQPLKTSQNLPWQPLQGHHAPLQPQTSGLGLENFVSYSSDGSTYPGFTHSGWCIFVYNLPPESDEIILWQLFGPFGAVQKVKISRDFNTKKCKHFGFVTMTNYNEAASAVASLNGYCLDGRVLQVSFKTNKIHRA